MGEGISYGSLAGEGECAFGDDVDGGNALRWEGEDVGHEGEDEGEGLEGLHFWWWLVLMMLGGVC